MHPDLHPISLRHYAGPVGRKDVDVNSIELFLQGAGIPRMTLITVPEGGTVRDLLEAAKRGGVRYEEESALVVILEDTDDPVSLNESMADVGIGSLGRVHVHSCRKVQVTVNFGGASKVHPFSPATTVRRVKRWADEKFELEGVDATEHALQLIGTDIRPDEDTHVGTLVLNTCEITFDLVPKKRVEG